MPTFQNWLPGHMTTPTNLVTTPTNIVITPISYTTITLYTVHNTGSSQPEEKRLAARSTASAIIINESKRKNSWTVVFPGHQRDKSRYSGTVPAISGSLLACFHLRLCLVSILFQLHRSLSEMKF